MELLAWIMMFLSCVVMLSWAEVKSSALLRRSWLIDG